MKNLGADGKCEFWAVMQGVHLRDGKGEHTCYHSSSELLKKTAGLMTLYFPAKVTQQK